MRAGVVTLEFHDYFADGARFDQRVCGRDGGRRETLIVEQGLQLAGVRQCGCFAQNLSVACAADAAKQGKESKDAGVGCAAK